MNAKKATILDVIEAFKQRGFEYVGKESHGWYRLHGQLTPAGSSQGYLCEIQLDPQSFELPRIQLLNIPEQLPEVVPHLDAFGGLCYLAKGTVVLDIFDPVGQSLACLERAAYVLGQILRGELVEDLAEEFHQYWYGLECLADIEGGDLGRQKCIVVDINGATFWFITDDENRTIEKLRSLGCQATDKTVLTYRVQTKVQPRPLRAAWPPTKVGDVLAWQGVLDPTCRKKIHQRIREGLKGKANGILILIESPLITYGLAVLYDRKAKQTKTRADLRRDTTFGLKVTPVSVMRIDNNYISQRNIPGLQTLARKNIAVIGCGTIGGYLSEMLVKAGAGVSGGRLTLVDYETLSPQNIGRHRLGFPDLFSNKAVAMAKELTRLHPGFDIRALPVDAKLAHLGNLDLIIDASGEEALGHWLSEKYTSQTAMLSVWIEGPGTAVRALLKVNDTGACFRCLCDCNWEGELRSVVGPLPSVMAGHGCEGLYVPFPASVSVQAASLGAEVILDWANGNYSPSLRTRIIDSSYQQSSPDCDPLRHGDCPICNS